MENLISLPEAVLQVANLGLSFAVVTLLFAMIFKFLPDVKVKWRDVWVGAMGTAILFTGGKYLLGLYLGRESVASAYGAAGSFVVILVWVYYSSLILLFGAEVTQVNAKKTGSWIAPTENAIPSTEEERAQEGIPHETLEPAAVTAKTSASPQQSSIELPPAGRMAEEACRREGKRHSFGWAVLMRTAFILPILLRRHGLKPRR